MEQNYVRFQRGLIANYQALATKSDDTLYFVYNPDNTTTALYLGNRLIAGTGEIAGASNLDELNDVLIKSIAGKDILQYDSAKKQWVNIAFGAFIEQIKTEFNFDNYVTQDELIIVNTKVSSIEEQLNSFATKAEVEAKADKATTLAGYGITDAYTKEETLTKISEKITEINGGETAGEVLADLNSYKEIVNGKITNIENQLNDLVLGEVNVINSVNENEFILENRHLSIKGLDASKIIGLDSHSAITDLAASLNEKVAQSVYEAQITSINNELSEIKEVITWKNL